MILRCVVVLIFPMCLYGQLVHPSNTPAFLQDEVAKIFINLDPQDFNTLVGDSLGSTYEFPATFIYQSTVIIDTVDTVGIRLRGNTSLQSAKKSFKIDFNVYQSGFKWNELKSLNLNGEHNDVSIMRSRTCQEMLRWAGLPCPRTSYIELYINGEYKGLYINVEHYDDQFLEARFINDDTGNLYKAHWGADLSFQGFNPISYDDIYELKTNEPQNDYSGLIHFIDVLNNASASEFPCAIQEVLDVDLFLNSLALQVLTGQWDGYSFNKNNYYLYQRPSDGKFVFIEYDMDNTFGVDWFGVPWESRNIYNWSPSNASRPLYTRMMQVPYFKDRYSYFIQQHLLSFFNLSYVSPMWESTQDLIAASALADDYKGLDYGFTDQDFLDAISNAWGGHVTMSLSDYLNERNISATNQLQYLDLNNPCSVGGLTTLNLGPPTEFKYWDVLGREISSPQPNQLFLEKSKEGFIKKKVICP